MELSNLRELKEEKSKNQFVLSLKDRLSKSRKGKRNIDTAAGFLYDLI